MNSIKAPRLLLLGLLGLFMIPTEAINATNVSADCYICEKLQRDTIFKRKLELGDAVSLLLLLNLRYS